MVLSVLPQPCCPVPSAEQRVAPGQVASERCFTEPAAYLSSEGRPRGCLSTLLEPEGDRALERLTSLRRPGPPLSASRRGDGTTIGQERVTTQGSRVGEPRVPRMDPSMAGAHIPIRTPLVAGAAGLGRAGVDLHPVGHHEGRVEAHSELADDLAAGLCLALQRIQEGLWRGWSGRRPPRGEPGPHQARGPICTEVALGPPDRLPLGAWGRPRCLPWSLTWQWCPSWTPTPAGSSRCPCPKGERYSVPRACPGSGPAVGQSGVHSTVTPAR